nr:hypothetical protein [Nonomuraea sediminis]
MAATAHVVQVLGAVLAPARHDDQAMLAAMAPDRALEVVVVLAGADARPVLVEQHLLDAVEQVGGDDRFVAALVFDAFVCDVAEVVPVLQHGADLVDGDLCACGVAFGGLHAEPGVGEGVADGFVVVGAGGVQLEGQANEGGALGVYGYGADLASFKMVAHVEVADRGAAQGATMHGFLAHLVGDVRPGCFGLVLVDRV